MACVLVLPRPHLCSWQEFLTRCRRPGTAWYWYPWGQTRAGIGRRRRPRNGCCRRSGWRSRFLEVAALGNTPLRQKQRREQQWQIEKEKKAKTVERVKVIIFVFISVRVCGNHWLTSVGKGSKTYRNWWVKRLQNTLKLTSCSALGTQCSYFPHVLPVKVKMTAPPWKTEHFF